MDKNDRFTICILLALAVAIAHGDGMFQPLCAENATPQNFFYHYQTIITGIIALAVGYVTVRAMQRHSDLIEEGRRLDEQRDISLRVNVIDRAITTEIERIRRWLNSVEKECEPYKGMVNPQFRVQPIS